MRLPIIVVAFLLTALHCQGKTELLKNADLEQRLSGSSWMCTACKVGETNDAYSGKQAIMAYMRYFNISNHFKNSDN